MPPKKIPKLKEKPQADHPVIDPTAIPPALPPSVEEAYRRKCIQLKQRTSEVEDENDATRVRLARIRRQVEKMRLERAMLLEQLTRRTSTNVEDSDGSPSPPPTPKEKPLRTKRGHRKPSLLADIDAAATKSAAASPLVNQHPATQSPSSEAFSHAQGNADSAAAAAPATTNGVSKPPKRPASAFDMYCEESRPALQKTPFQSRYDDALAQYQKDKAKYDATKAAETAAADKTAVSAEPEAETKDEAAEKSESLPEAPKDKDDEDDKDEKDDKGDKDDKEGEATAAAEAEKAASKSPAPTPAPAQDEDVEMTNYDTEEAEGTPAADDR
ncbi:uncharacterized protein VDAG_10231 [Verticillium dahliae VdLs.17]|uniref:INO80 complex subunit F domain-containing protein n=1 Tax=Verticillium dahliae (strain VdLs.17 / ATCC MYA-4575 / FGSC 10137) TaxID=498257 RepID=G2XJ99_VERDV|nr:uncharacterized protein VDAG_10231 [Verticillium dahliae VdLs.17]EGY20602.1 hypothetical protein VDAG_10231 [Verticillium dahliae VdLs.17]KAH6694420.1 hypothetical protein EV126DRAFT_345477 [Verticillium dahliae]